MAFGAPSGDAEADFDGVPSEQEMVVAGRPGVEKLLAFDKAWSRAEDRR